MCFTHTDDIQPLTATRGFGPKVQSLVGAFARKARKMPEKWRKSFMACPEYNGSQTRRTVVLESQARIFASVFLKSRMQRRLMFIKIMSENAEVQFVEFINHMVQLHGFEAVEPYLSQISYRYFHLWIIRYYQYAYIKKIPLCDDVLMLACSCRNYVAFEKYHSLGARITEELLDYIISQNLNPYFYTLNIPMTEFIMKKIVQYRNVELLCTMRLTSSHRQPHGSPM